MDRRFIGAGIACWAAFLAGCHSKTATPYPEWVGNIVPSESSDSTAFAIYRQAGRDAEARASKYLDRVTFTPGQRKAAETALARPLDQLVSGTRRESVGYRYLPGSPTDVPLYARGWRLIGLALAWRIERNVESGNLDAAIRDLIAATRFGFDLGHGSTLESSQGLALIDESRRAFLPAFDRLDRSQLSTLAMGLKRALERRAEPEVTLSNERLAMLSSVQHVQDCFRDRKTRTLIDEIGHEAVRAVDYLERMWDEGDEARVRYFNGFAEEAESQVDYWRRLAATPMLERSNVSPPRRSESRPWRRLAKHYFTTGGAWLTMKDTTLARTRLLLLEAELRVKVKRDGYAPKGLEPFGDQAIDPHTGKPFAYRRDGKQFRIYSVGMDGKDDGGQTDEVASQPDLTLEMSS